jgi:hypothetical protein
LATYLLKLLLDGGQFIIEADPGSLQFFELLDRIEGEVAGMLDHFDLQL